MILKGHKSRLQHLRLVQPLCVYTTSNHCSRKTVTQSNVFFIYFPYFFKRTCDKGILGIESSISKRRIFFLQPKLGHRRLKRRCARTIAAVTPKLAAKITLHTWWQILRGIGRGDYAVEGGGVLLCCKLIGEHTKETHRFEAAKTHYFRWVFFFFFLFFFSLCVCVLPVYSPGGRVFLSTLFIQHVRGGKPWLELPRVLLFFLSSLSLSVAFFFIKKKKIKN